MGSGGRALAQGTWTQYAGGPERTSTILSCQFDPTSLASPAWTASHDSLGRTISFVGLQQPLVSLRDVIVVGSVLNGGNRLWRVFAFHRRTGAIHWEAPIPAPVSDSWSTPAIDPRTHRVYVASGSYITCLHLHTGAQLWQTALQLPVVNASPCLVAVSQSSSHLYITDYDGASGGGHLYCISTGLRIPVVNPVTEGQLLWKAFLDGASGSTPAAADGCVYVSTPGNHDYGVAGSVRAFNAIGKPLWKLDNPIGEGYFGGVGIQREGGKSFVIASSYPFYGNSLSGSTEKISAETGTRVWSAPSNRTSSIAIPINGSFYAVTGGISGFGTTPTLQYVEEDGNAAYTVWSSLGQSRMGGWAAQPVYDATHERLYVGEIATGGNSFAPGIRLHVINAKRLANELVLEEQVYPGFAASPAIAGVNLYATGAAGLYAFGPRPINGDINDDGIIDIEDLYQYGDGVDNDVDGDGVLTPHDRDLLEELVIGDDLDMWEAQRRVKG